MRSERTLDSDDLAQIHALLARYCIAVDWGSARDVVGLFHPEGTLLPYFQGDARCEGGDAIAAWLDGYFEKTRAPRRYVRHKPFAPAIVVEGERARSSMYFDAESVVKGEEVVNITAGRYDSTFVKQDGQWLIQEHSIITYYVRRTTGFTPMRDGPVPIVLAEGGP
jgi:hypothetical protein